MDQTADLRSVHLVGHLQSNKAKAGRFDDSPVDSARWCLAR
jgi:hypothetical protein